jgi:hypothetical protein
MTITTIERAVAKALHADLAAAIKASTHLAAVAAKYGLIITPTNASFDGASMTIKVKAAVPLSAAAVRADLVQLAAMEGFDASGTSKDGKYKVTDYGRGKQPWKMGLADGSEPQRYWKADSRWMLRAFPPVKDDQKVVITEVDDLIAKA